MWRMNPWSLDIYQNAEEKQKKLVWRWPYEPDKGFYQIGDVEQEIETPLDTGSSNSSLGSSNLLVRVGELDYLYK